MSLTHTIRILRAAAVTLAAASVLAAAFTAAPQHALAASGGDGCTGYSTGGGWWVQCQHGGSPGGGSSGGSEHCIWSTDINKYFPGFTHNNPPPKGYIYVIGPICGPGGRDSWPLGPRQIFIDLVRNGGQLTPQALARQAYAELAPPTPAAQTAPPRTRAGLVGLAEWYWVPAGQWQPLTKRLAVGPVWAQVTATPARLTFSPGSGLPAVTCPGPGTVYNPALPAASQRTPCSYTYTRSSDGLPGNAYTASVTIEWKATWQGSGGTGGTLPALTRTTTFPLRIGEAQALNGTGR
jgi:hypothetical protein